MYAQPTTLLSFVTLSRHFLLQNDVFAESELGRIYYIKYLATSGETNLKKPASNP